MKPRSNYSIFGRSFGRTNEEPPTTELQFSGSDLERAYRQLLLDNQVLTESNQRLLERVERAEKGQGESPAARQLIRAQRDALADRSRQLRELQYANKSLQREKDQLTEQNRALHQKLAREATESAPLAKELNATRREVEHLKVQLAEKRRELALLTDRYYQLQSRLDPALSADRVINADF